MKRNIPIARHSRLRRVSARRKKLDPVYARRRADYLSRHPRCQAWATIVTHCPEARLPRHCPRATEIHHMRGRLNGHFLNEGTWLAVCRVSHDWIHTHPKRARELGLLF